MSDEELVATARLDVRMPLGPETTFTLSVVGPFGPREAQALRDFLAIWTVAAPDRAPHNHVACEHYRRVAESARDLFPVDAGVWDSPRFETLQAALAALADRGEG